MKTILLVEDDDHLRELVRETLQDPSRKILEVRDGQQAVEAICSTDIDLLVLDWMLPGMAGIHIMRQLRGSPRMPPTIMVTAKTRERDFVRARDAGVRHFITKPFSPKDLLEKVAEVLD
jgi:two-component system phosphate regulon response regulator PhoB